MISAIESQPAGSSLDLIKQVEQIFSPTGILSRSKNFEFRPQQQQMAAAVARALENQEHLAVEAGTGRLLRIPLRLRRAVSRLSGFRVVPFDPVLRDRRNEPARREAWMRDQYQHPEEHRHTLAEVQDWFAENGVEYLRAYPSAMLCEESEELFAGASDNWRFEGWLAQAGWIGALGHEGGLFVTVGRRA